LKALSKPKAGLIALNQVGELQCGVAGAGFAGDGVSGAGVAGAGAGVTAGGVLFGTFAGAAPVVVDELEDGGLSAVVEFDRV
jgi:hypothetical protein